MASEDKNKQSVKRGRPPALVTKQMPKPKWPIIPHGISGLFLVGVLLWGINQFLSLRGVVHVQASRIILACMWPIGILLVAVLVSRSQLARWLKVSVVVLAALVIAAALLCLDRWALKLAEQSPPTKEEMLQASVSANLGTPPDDVRGSIEWKPEYIYIRLLLNDPGPTDFDGLDLSVSFDIAIAAMDQTTKFAGVSVFPDTPTRMLSATVTAVDKNGNRVEIPAYPGKISSSSVWRIRCEHVPRRSFIEFVAAGVVLNIPSGYSAWGENREYGPRRLPTVMNISGSYKVGPKLVKFSNSLSLNPLP